MVTVEAKKVTSHCVRVASTEVQRLAGGAGAERLLDASFRFLLDRESNTSILPSFELSVISRYFPEYEREIADYLRRTEPDHRS